MYRSSILLAVRPLSQEVSNFFRLSVPVDANFEVALPIP
jgi:hypothetical protein